MEKHSTLTVTGKRPRKISMTAASEPKNLKLDLTTKKPLELQPVTILKNLKPVSPHSRKSLEPQSDTKLKNLKLDSPLARKPLKPQSVTKLSSVLSIANQPQINQATKKKKPKTLKPIPMYPSTTMEINQAETTNQSQQALDTIQKNLPIAKPAKKKKKKELLTEFNALKEQVIGPQGLELVKPKSSPKTRKSPPRSKIIKESNNEYPILSDKELIDKFLKVPMNNNQKGRIRQTVKLSLQGTNATTFPDIINGKIQAILTGSPELTDSELRRVRILFNMLKTSLEKPEELETDGTESPKKSKENKVKKKKEVKDGDEGKVQEKPAQKKVKGPKRYVVFLGNLPLDVSKEKIMDHFRELNEQIINIRLPKRPQGTKSAIAYVELSNEPSYELALSKHHSMLGSRRIRVLYTTQKNGKITRGQARGKSAKLIALQKSGKLIGSLPTAKKRSHRRKIMKQAQAKQAAAESAPV